MVNWEPMNDPLSEYLREHCLPGLMPMGEIRLGTSGLIMPKEFVKYVDRIRDFKVRADDVWVISYPKCGTTWTQEMVWLLKNNLDFDRSNKELLLQRVPFLEAVGIISEEQKEGPADGDWVFSADTISFADELPSPRCIKTHLPVSLLPKEIWTVKPKMIYVSRNPKDAAVSYYHHHRLWNGYTGLYHLFMQAFIEDRLVYSPFWEHVIEYKKLEKTLPNLLCNTYEEMKKDLEGVVKRTAEFLGKSLFAEDLAKLTEHLSFKSMKQNCAINGEEICKAVKQRHGMDEEDPELSFLRKGETGSWKVEMTPDIARQFDLWATKKTKGTILEGTY